jgi:hypothetical protein
MHRTERYYGAFRRSITLPNTGQALLKGESGANDPVGIALMAARTRF